MDGQNHGGAQDRCPDRTGDTNGRRAGTNKRDSLSPDVLERLRDLEDLRERFAACARLQDLLNLLLEFGLTDEDIARAMPSGVHPRSVKRWREQGPPVTRAATRWEQVDDLRAIISFLLADGTYDQEAIVAWLRSRQPALELERPLDALRERNFEDVLEAAERAIRPMPDLDDDAIGPPQQALPKNIPARARTRR